VTYGNGMLVFIAIKILNINSVSELYNGPTRLYTSYDRMHNTQNDAKPCLPKSARTCEI